MLLPIGLGPTIRVKRAQFGLERIKELIVTFPTPYRRCIEGLAHLMSGQGFAAICAGLEVEAGRLPLKSREVQRPAQCSLGFRT